MFGSSEQDAFTAREFWGAVSVFTIGFGEGGQEVLNITA